MSTIAKSSLRFFLKDGRFAVEKQPVEDCVLEGEELREFELKNCTCRNVTFRNAVAKMLVIENCAFINCRFENTVGSESDEGAMLRVCHTSFTGCAFDKVTLTAQKAESRIEKVHFDHCEFAECTMKVKGDAEALRVRGCEARQFSYQGEVLRECEFTDLELTDVELAVRAQENRFEKVKFENVELTGSSEKNFFKDCDMKGYRFRNQEKN